MLINKAPFLILSALVLSTFLTPAAEPFESLFHVGSGKQSPAWDKVKKTLESSALDNQAVLSGKKPIYAEPDSAQESTAEEQFYKADGYQLHVLKIPLELDGVSGFVFGSIIEFDPDFVEGDMRSTFHTTYFTAEALKKPFPSDTPFQSAAGTGKDKPAWKENTQKRMEACAADYAAVLAGKKPVHAKPAEPEETHFFKGDGYEIDIIDQPVVIGGVSGVFYGPMLELGQQFSPQIHRESISHVSFYSADELKKL